MNIYRYAETASISNGTWSGTTLFISGGICRQFWVSTSTNSTSFNATVIDDGGREVRGWYSYTGKVNDLTSFPLYGIYTINISGSQNNEPFDILMLTRL